MKTTINKNQKMKFEEQFKLNDSTITNDKQTISNKFNDFFINVGPTLSRKIPKQNVLPEHYMKLTLWIACILNLYLNRKFLNW